MRKIHFLFLIIFILGAFFRFYQIMEVPPGLYPDEAMNGNNALEALATGDFKIFYPENNGREGLFINIQALSVKAFGNEPWALRVVSALFGALTILGLYLLSRELFRSNLRTSDVLRLVNFGRSDVLISLFSTFFIATSYWHINFSRIGFRAIMVPFLATFGLYFLLKGLRRGTIWDLVLAGIFIGLGFHTYIAFRFVPFVLLIPLAAYLMRWKGWFQMSHLTSDSVLNGTFDKKSKSCTPCLAALFLFIAFVVALPIGFYFLQHPTDFLGRGGQVSIFSAESPIKEFVKSNVLTLGMFFVRGDCNGRHNYACQPELNPVVGIFFLIGVISIFRKSDFLTKSDFRIWTLLAWLIFMSFPATLTREGLPHALRAIGMIPPIMILAGLGAERIIAWTKNWLESQRSKWPQYSKQLYRIQWEAALLLGLALMVIPLITYRDYFLKWAGSPDAYYSFAADTYGIGKFLETLPQDVKKYVVVNVDGVDVRGVPMPAQTIMFTTDTFRVEERALKNFVYLAGPNILDAITIEDQKVLIAFLNSGDKELVQAIRKKYPELQVKVPGDFVVLYN